MGGATAIEYAAKHPERVVGLVIAGVPPKIPKEQSEPIMKSLRSDAYQKVMDDYVNVQLMGAKPTTDALLKPSYQKIDKATTINSVDALFSGDPGTALKKYIGPKLIISSVAEEKQPVTLHKQEPSIPFKTINNTSHWIMLDQPEEFIRLLDEFINSVDKK
ncbi:MAG TPA: alpha/beta hydrolase [Cyclobacteriaceae bacterium]